MSAFSHRYLDALSTAAQSLSVLGSPVGCQLEELLALLERLSDCQSCGVLFEGRGDECHHCQGERRHVEAMEDREGVR